jgi:serine protease inhibitor
MSFPLALIAALILNYNAFGISALQHLAAQSTSNVFISPVSIGVALSMAADGAKGSTRTAMLRTLRISGSDLDAGNSALVASLARNPDASVGLANALWLRSDIPPSPGYVSQMRAVYGARVAALRFGDVSAAQAINAWTKQHTLGLIDRLVDRTSPMDFAYLTNALAFKAGWSSPFEKEATAPAPFTNANGSKTTVPMMTHDGTFARYNASGFRALRLPYGKGGYAAYVLLANGSDADALVSRLSASTFDTIARAAAPEFLSVSIPRFIVRYRTSLIPLLRSMGMGIAFSSAADFSAMRAPPPSLLISSVEHASYVRVDEAGTAAAAATSVGMQMKSKARPPQERFVVDRPFVLAIRDEHTGALLFLGVIRTLAESAM